MAAKMAQMNLELWNSTGWRSSWIVFGNAECRSVLQVFHFDAGSDQTALTGMAYWPRSSSYGPVFRQLRESSLKPTSFLPDRLSMTVSSLWRTGITLSGYHCWPSFWSPVSPVSVGNPAARLTKRASEMLITSSSLTWKSSNPPQASLARRNKQQCLASASTRSAETLTQRYNKIFLETSVTCQKSAK